MRHRCALLLILVATLGSWNCRPQNGPSDEGRANRQEQARPQSDTPVAAAKRRQEGCPAGEPYPIAASPADIAKPEEKWKGDLNGDGRADLLLVDRGACSNWGDCPFTLFLSCESRQIPLWSGYAHQAELTDSGTAWKELVILQRNADSANDRMKRIRLRFDGTRYRPAPEQN